MYTDSHGSYRSIVFKAQDQDQIIHVYPLEEKQREILPDSLKQMYRDSHRVLKSTVFFPDFYTQEALETSWLNRTEFDNGTFYIYTTDIDIDRKKIINKLIYELE